MTSPQGDSFNILQDLQTTNILPAQRRQSHATNFWEGGEKVDTNELVSCGMRETASVEDYRLPRGVEDENILEDLAAAEDEWMAEFGHRIII